VSNPSREDEASDLVFYRLKLAYLDRKKIKGAGQHVSIRSSLFFRRSLIIAIFASLDLLAFSCKRL